MASVGAPNGKKRHGARVMGTPHPQFPKFGGEQGGGSICRGAPSARSPVTTVRQGKRMGSRYDPRGYALTKVK